MRVRLIAIAVVVVAVAGLWRLNRGTIAASRTTGTLSQGVYVWQREWNETVCDAVRSTPGDIRRTVALAAEAAVDGRAVKVSRVALDMDVIRGLGRPVGIALRMGPFGGPFRELGEPFESLAALADEQVTKFRDAGIEPAELQIDFDCAASKLDGYRFWIESLRRRKFGVPIVITALPSWLSERAFRRLAEACDGYVLQVHSLEPPAGPNAPIRICEVVAARRAVELAGAIGVPFRVALPTYGYVVGFDGSGALIGLQADGPRLTWPADATLRVVRSDPASMADLVRYWTDDRPAAMGGIIWYRLPVEGDALNWRMPTLLAVMGGRAPVGDVRVDVRRGDPGLVELVLANVGEADAALPKCINVNWRAERRVVASDAIGGYECAAADRTNRLRFVLRRDAALESLAPAGRAAIGWIRFDNDTEVEVDVAEHP